MSRPVQRRRGPRRVGPHGAFCGLWMVLLVASLGMHDSLRAQVTHSMSQLEYEMRSQSGEGEGRRLVENPAVVQHRLYMMQIAHFKSMQRDTDRLQALAVQLETERAGGQGPYTPAQLRTLIEIEKLAHHIKEEMRSDGPARFVEPNLFQLPASMR